MWLIPLGLAGVFNAQKKSCSSNSARSIADATRGEREDETTTTRARVEGAWEAEAQSYCIVWR